MRLIRGFFHEKKVLEVDTRLMDQFSVTDPYMNALAIQTNEKKLFLQTSPEYAMKRLLSQGSGDIYQLGKAFRAEENGPYHDNEFTMLEWYRLGFSLEKLMSEVYQLIVMVVGDKNKKKLTYQQVFWETLKFDPFNISTEDLEVIARNRLGDIPSNLLHDNYLTLLFSELIEAALPADEITFIYNYPQSQASLAKLKLENGNMVAERFEVINDNTGTEPFVVIGSSGHNFAIAFSSFLTDGTELTFTAIEESLPVVMQDNEGNLWNIMGEAISGSRTGEKLVLKSDFIAYWFAWVAFHPTPQIHEFN